MDRDSALELLRGGVEGVTKWNQLEVEIRKGIDLRGANLREADLHEANLFEARLHDVVLSDSNLRRADLRGADLSRADLSMADLSGADLHAADLTEANLRETHLRETNFFGAYFRRTNITNVDLSNALDLEYASHQAASSVGTDTIIKSKGKIPDVFLRGCGLPGEWITYIPSLIGSLSPIDFYSCFISYSHDDEEFAQRLHGKLTQDKLRVWYAPEDMKRGEKIHEQIESAIRVHDKLLLVLSEKSMASEWVNHEIYTARQREKKEGRKVLFPIALCPFDEITEWKSFDADTGRDMAREIREYYVPDLSNWKDHVSFETEYAKLLRDLQKSAEPTEPKQ